MQTGRFAPGFRLSMLDVVVLAVGMMAAIGLATVVWWWGFVIAFVLGHFFLFCNVIRMSRPLELTWAGTFLALAAPTVLADRPGWLMTASLTFAVTLLVVVLETRKPSYHGVGWQRINPRLPEWWEAQTLKRECG